MRAQPPRQQGFTLLELLVAMVVIAIATGMIVVRGTPGAQNHLLAESQRLTQVLRIAQQHAILKSRDVRWVPNAKGYTFEILEGSRWTPLQGENSLRPRLWPQEGMQAVVRVDGRSTPSLTLEPVAGLQQLSVTLVLQNRQVTMTSAGGSAYKAGPVLAVGAPGTTPLVLQRPAP